MKKTVVCLSIIFVIVLAHGNGYGIGFGIPQRPRHNQKVQQRPVANPATCHSVGQKAFQYTNKFRRDHRFPILQWNQALAERARIHSMNMGLKKVEFGHDGFKERVDKLRLPKPLKSAAENVFMGNMSGDIAQVAVDGWIDSPGHLQNMVGKFTHCGIGVYQNSEGFWYFTQIFALL